jgi:hypothetical protein
MRVAIPVYISEGWHQRPLGEAPYRCPSCGWSGQARVNLRWRLRRLWGLPMRSALVSAQWTCGGCREVAAGPNPTGAQPPFHHRFGGVIFLVVFLGAVVGGFYALWPKPSHYSFPADPPPTPREAQSHRVTAALGEGQAAEDRCKAKVREAIAKAVPGPFLELASLRPAQPIDVSKLPTAPASDQESGTWWTTCDADLPAGTRDTMIAGSESIEAIDAAIEVYTKGMAALEPPELFLVMGTHNDDSSHVYVDALITRDGQLLGVAAAAGADSHAVFEAQKAQLKSWRKPARNHAR